MSPREFLVIGGGLAGLSAAARLIEKGHAVRLIEARDRLGGRAWSVDRPGRSPVELGAEWVADDGAVRDLCREAGIPFVAANGRRLRRVGSGWQSIDELPDLNADLIARMQPKRGDDRSLEMALADCCGGSELAEARTLLRGYVEGFHAADPKRLSVHWLDEVEANQPADASSLRLPGGTGQMIRSLAMALDGASVHLNAPVRAIRWRKGNVVADSDMGRWEGDAAIVTVPLSIFKAAPEDPDALRFDPPLAETRAAAQRLEMGGVVKLSLEFREAFWRSMMPLRDALFVQGFGQPFPAWWTPVDPAEPTLIGWAGGPAADRLASHSRERLVEIAVESLAGTLGIPAAEIADRLVTSYYHDWASDPFARGAYSYVGVGGMSAHESLARPIEGTLCLAGEACAGRGLNATMDGAIDSGRRAAESLA